MSVAVRSGWGRGLLARLSGVEVEVERERDGSALLSSSWMEERMALERGSLALVSALRARRRFSAMAATAFFDFLVPKASVRAAREDGVGGGGGLVEGSPSASASASEASAAAESSVEAEGSWRTLERTVIFLAGITLRLFVDGSKMAMYCFTCLSPMDVVLLSVAR